MSLDNIAKRALREIKEIEGSGLNDGHDAEILAAIDTAMRAAMRVCCAEHASVVEAHLSHATGVAERINEESERRRKLLVSNLSAMR